MKPIFVNVSFTAKGNYRITDAETNRKLDKCSMSFYFPAWSYFGIYWDTCNYNKMCIAFLELPNVYINKDETYKYIDSYNNL